MSDNVSMNNALNSLKNNVKGKDFSGLNNKVINDVSLFDTVNGEKKFNEKLTNKDDFISAFQTGKDEDNVSTEQLSAIYDMLDTDKDGKVNENELKLFASLGGDNKKDAIDVNDFSAMVNMSKSNKAQIGQQMQQVRQNSQNTQNVNRNQNGAKMQAVMKNDARIQTGQNGQKFVAVEGWGSSKNANDCLEAIIQNSYDLSAMGIKAGSEEYNNLLKAVMDANPKIYGTQDGGWRQEVGGKGRSNAVLYTGDNIVLPNFEFVKKAQNIGGQNRQNVQQQVHQGANRNQAAVSRQNSKVNHSNNRQGAVPPSRNQHELTKEEKLQNIKEHINNAQNEAELKKWEKELDELVNNQTHPYTPESQPYKPESQTLSDDEAMAVVQHEIETTADPERKKELEAKLEAMKKAKEPEGQEEPVKNEEPEVKDDKEIGSGSSKLSNDEAIKVLELELSATDDPEKKKELEAKIEALKGGSQG
ncbi:hypothetical protein IJ843_08405 [bacterium]|nr:hypothetical protein [bacterium]